MLKSVAKQTGAVRSDHRFAIVAAKYNQKYVDGMLMAAKKTLRTAGARPSHVTVVRVPGSFEIPVVAAKLAAREERQCSAVICLGVILRGETSHADHIGLSVSQALLNIQVTHLIPVIHEVLVLQDERQAQVRCLSKTHNRGAEAAQTAIAMANLVTAL